MRKIQECFRRLSASQTGRFISIVVAALAAIVVVRGCQQPKIAVDVSEMLKAGTSGEFIREKADQGLRQLRPQPVAKTNSPVPVLPPIHLGGSNAPVSSAGLVLPAMRLISCTLINTVESSSLDTPIIALVAQDVFWRGKLMVPKGTEVHGRAQAHHLRDRIGSQREWTLIWADGTGLSVNGLALDMDQKEGHWGPTDGRAGLTGRLERSGNTETLKLFGAAFLGGLTEVFQQRQNTVLGSQVLPTLKNAALSGTDEVLDSYARQLLQSIEQESTYVRVPGGKTFYLYTLDPIRPPTTSIPPR